MTATVHDPRTPYLLLDRATAEANVARLHERISALGVALRPHLKTTKSVDAARLLFGDEPGPITVSTLAEAEAFATAGFTDILYAVGISPSKLDAVLALHARGVRLTVLLDSMEQAEAVARASRESGTAIPALIEIDCDGHRGGLLPADPSLTQVAAALAGSSAREGGGALTSFSTRAGREAGALVGDEAAVAAGEVAAAEAVAGGVVAGVLVHAGESYHARGLAALVAAAENERAVAVRAAERLRAAGHACPIVSVGSTPTAHVARDLTGVTEVRAGNYVLFDLVMAGIGVCRSEDIAAAVVVTVIGHRPERGWIMTDGGWMATSRDRGTATQPVDQRYGLVTALDGTPYPDLLMHDASQEHGVLALRTGTAAALPDLPVGTRVRILPNHACATTAQHDGYHVREAATSDLVTAWWPRIRGW